MHQNEMNKEIWRKNWLSCINELTSFQLQKESWLDLGNNNPHWSFVEFISCYFDDLYIQNNYEEEVKLGFITEKEQKTIIEWHKKLELYNPPKNVSHDHAAILKDKNWQSIVREGKKAKEKLSFLLNEKEARILNQTNNYREINANSKTNLLFICTMNKWRSKTAESVFKNSTTYNSKSAGTSKKAKITVNENLIEWADKIYVMEKKHKEILMQKFHSSLSKKQIITLNISDIYKYMDPELIQILKDEIEEAKK